MSSNYTFPQSGKARYFRFSPFRTTSFATCIFALIPNNLTYYIITTAKLTIKTFPIKNLLINCAPFAVILFCNILFADQIKINTSPVSDEKQLIVTPINMLLDLGETGYVNVLVIDKEGNPIEGTGIRVLTQDNTKITTVTNSLVTDVSGFIFFSIIAKQQGNTIITVSDEKISSQINVSVRKLNHYALPYFYGNMQLDLINPTNEINHARIQLYEKSDRPAPSIIIMLEPKEMKRLKLSEEMNLEITDGWVEILSTEITCGGVWTSKGYLSFLRLK